MMMWLVDVGDAAMGPMGVWSRSLDPIVHAFARVVFARRGGFVSSQTQSKVLAANFTFQTTDRPGPAGRRACGAHRIRIHYSCNRLRSAHGTHEHLTTIPCTPTRLRLLTV